MVCLRIRTKPWGSRSYCQSYKCFFDVFTFEKYFLRSEFLSGQRQVDFLIVENFLTENMKIQRILKSTVLSAAIAFASTAFAAESKVEAEKPEFDDLPSPEFSGGKQKPFKPKDWLEVTANFKVQLSPEPESKTADEVLVKWYVAVKNPEGKGFLKLTKSITHINVPLNEDIVTSVYISPASIMLLTGSPKGGKGSVEYVGYEILVNGEVKATGTNKSPDKWWALASKSISDSTKVPLLAKNETPFAAMWWDMYAEVKQEK